jgi:hypothetical protein
MDCGGIMTLEEILNQAQLARTGMAEYLYKYFKRQIEELNLEPIDYEEAIRRLCKALDY